MKNKYNIRKWELIISMIIPLVIFGYVIYMNWLPFGYEKTFVLDVGSGNDMDSSHKLYLAESSDLSSQKTYENKTFRTLIGTTELVFKPKAILRNAILNVSVKGKNVFIVPPKIDFNSLDYDWNLSIDFSEGIPEFLEVNTNFSQVYQQQYTYYLQKERNISIDFSKGIPKFLNGNAIIKNNCVYFNGSAKMTYPETEDNFEKDSFAVYVEWTPEDNKSNFQQIVGHYNWEIVQNNQSVSFQVGRMNNKTGTQYSVSFPVDEGFFNKKHSALALYLPDENERGLIGLYIDDIFINKKIISQDIIWRNYSQDPLSFGKSRHGVAEYFKGCIHKVEFINQNLSSFNLRQAEYELIKKKLIQNQDCLYFDGQTSISYPLTENQFEKGTFAVYVEWTPKDNNLNFQQIVGHYNWEIVQESKRIRFIVGRMNNATGQMYSIIYPIDINFFDKKHSALAIYNPTNITINGLHIFKRELNNSTLKSQIQLPAKNKMRYDINFLNQIYLILGIYNSTNITISMDGYIEFFVDNNFAGRTYFSNATIWDKYGNHPLTFGKSYHGIATYYKGCMHKFKFINNNFNFLNDSVSFSGNILDTKLYLVGNGEIDSVKLYTKKQDDN